VTAAGIAEFTSALPAREELDGGQGTCAQSWGLLDSLSSGCHPQDVTMTRSPSLRELGSGREIQLRRTAETPSLDRETAGLNIFWKDVQVL